MNSDRPHLAVIGGGVAGIVAAHLLQKRYRVTLWEAGSYLGGHTNTVTIPSGPDEGLSVDTGFIVFNLKTYPNFVRFLQELEVGWQESDMSFGYECSQSGWVYGGHDLDSFFADRSNLWRPRFWRFALDLLRFNWMGTRLAQSGRSSELTLRQFVRSFSADLVQHYVEPIGASIWSTPTQQVLDFPALSFFRFFRNHGLLQVFNRPQWLTVQGGSHQYVKAFLGRFEGDVWLNNPVEAVVPADSGHGRGGRYQVRGPYGSRDYDAVVLATHADTSLRLLPHASVAQKRLLGPWRYLNNTAILHSDTNLLPHNARARSSWNYRRSPGSLLPSLTYDMNRLQRLPTQNPFLVSLNGDGQVAESKVIGQWRYAHPQYDTDSLKTQELLPSLNGDNLAFCGSYHGYGFHEDAVLSAVRAAASLGVDW